MPGENQDYFAEALAESGATIESPTSSTSDEKQELQTSTAESTAESTTESTTEQSTDETSATAEQTEEGTEEGAQVENSATTGESKKKSGIVDYNSEETSAEASEEEQTQSTSNPINFNEMFGEGYENAEDVKSRLNQVTDLETQVEELKNAKPDYANEFVQKMDEITRAGGDPVAFAKLNGINVSELSAMEALKMNLQFEHGLSNKESEAFIGSKYKTEDFDDENGTRTDPKSVQLTIDGNNAKKLLAERQADNTLVQPAASTGLSEDEWNQKQEEANIAAKEADEVRMWDEKTGWAPEVSRVVDDLKTKGILIPIGGGKAFNFAYDKNEEYTTAFIGKVDQALSDSGTSREEDPKLAENIANLIFFSENKDEMFRAYGDEVRSMEAEDYHKLSHNPSAIKRGAPVPKQNDKPLSAEEQMEKVWG